MTFFLDQDVPDDLAHWMRHRGHTVTRSDPEVLAWAHAHGAILVACNRDDFIALRPQGEHPGCSPASALGCPTLEKRLGFAHLGLREGCGYCSQT